LLALARAVRGSGAAIELSGQPADENTLDEPTKIASAKKKLENAGAKFTYVFPGDALPILRLKARR